MGECARDAMAGSMRSGAEYVCVCMYLYESVSVLYNPYLKVLGKIIVILCHSQLMYKHFS